MNWYNINKQSMALPEIDNEYSDDAIKKIFIDYIDKELSDETKKKFDMENRNRNYLDVGSQGIVYDIGDDAVEKITRDAVEYENAQYIIDLQKESGILPFVVGVFYADKVQKKQELYRIVMEKVNILSEEEQKFFRQHFNNMYLMEHRLNFIGSDFYDGMLQFIRYLKEYNFYPYDMAPFNVGRRKDGTFVVLDLGAIQKK